jgi:hypothetical protein
MTTIIIGVSFAFLRIFVPKTQNCTTTRCDTANEMHFLIQHNEISKSHVFLFLPQKKMFFLQPSVIRTDFLLYNLFSSIYFILKNAFPVIIFEDFISHVCPCVCFSHSYREGFSDIYCLPQKYTFLVFEWFFFLLDILGALSEVGVAVKDTMWLTFFKKLMLFVT